ncbi:MAG TPA: hypothetical protein DD727_04180 [Clostridiales bacterium]|nr:hypothetical protein [Clostridiales bacterium]
MNDRQLHYEEKVIQGVNGMLILLLNILMMLGSIPLLIGSTVGLDSGGGYFPYGLGLTVALVWLCLVGPLLFAGIKILKPNEALVLTLFGKYYGSLKAEGIFFVNPFVTASNPALPPPSASIPASEHPTPVKTASQPSRKISLKAMTLNNDKQKINDLLGNPIIIGIVVVWKVTNTAKAVFNVDNYREFLSMQCDSSLRNVVRLYPYDVSNDGDEKSLRGSSQEIAGRLKEEIQSRVDIAGLEICEARITHLAYAPEIAAVMLQRQQASAIIDARKMIVEGAVSMVEMALEKLTENKTVNLDDERKAAMVSNLLVVLCGNRDAQPVVNSGSIY